MKQSKDISKVKEFDKISKKCNADREPIYITKDGNVDMGIMSKTAYENALITEKVANMINASLEDVENGAVPFCGEDFFNRMKEKYKISSK